MKNRKQHASVRMILSVSLAIALLSGCFVAPASTKSATTVDFDATVISVREVLAGSPMPGIHLDAKVNNRMTDIYLAPASFLAACGASFSKGDAVSVVGSIGKSGDVDLVLAREIRSGMVTLYLRNEEGEPLWPGASAD
jgi:hypothetical protein